MFEYSHEKLSQLYLLTLRVVNGVECTTRSIGIPPEHPRASTSDDVECFFSVLRDMVGKDFTHKEV